MPKFGYKHTDEARAKIREARSKQVITDETRAKISAANTGKKRTPEQNAINSASKIGKKQSPETIAKISTAHRGKKHSEESKAKMSEARKGKKLSPEHCAKISESWKHRAPVSEETKQKMRVVRKGKYCGEKNPNWQGGIAYLPYCQKFNNEFKERVRDFYGRVCVECGKPESENGERLSVHHVLFNKNTCCDNSAPLFVALCHSCHTRTNSNREYWEEKYTNLINEKYGGKCYYTKEEYNSIAQEA